MTKQRGLFVHATQLSFSSSLATHIFIALCCSNFSCCASATVDQYCNPNRRSRASGGSIVENRATGELYELKESRKAIRIAHRNTCASDRRVE